MAIPLVQATLHMAYQQSFAPQATGERVLIDEVKGAAYAATVLPLVHDCGKKVFRTPKKAGTLLT